MIGLLDEALKDNEITLTIKNNYFKIMRDASQLMEHVIKDITDFSDIRSNKMVIKMEGFPLRDTICEVFEMFGLHARFKGLKYDLDIDENVPDYVKSDKARLSQVFINLISNAFKFTQKGIIRVSIKAENLSEVATNDSFLLQIIVEDRGIGISPSGQDALRNILNNPEDMHYVTGLRNSKGVCLGLTMSQIILKKMGSEGIQFTSLENFGSTFSFKIPTTKQEKPSPSFIPLLPDQAAYDPENCSCKKILIIDDNEFNILALRMRLQRMSYEVSYSFSGKSGIELLSNIIQEPGCGKLKCRKVKVILMDVDMPEMNGLEATKYIKNMLKIKNLMEIPIIGCSALSQEKDFQLATAAGMDKYLIKPIQEEQLEDLFRIF